jgi:hypothetical protein
LADHPDRIEGAARSAATGNTAIRTIEDSMNNRARFSPQEIKSILARSGEISETPLDYTSGMSVSGSKGNCVPLPPGTGSVGTYMATCNTGYTAEQKSAILPDHARGQRGPAANLWLLLRWRQRGRSRRHLRLQPLSGTAVHGHSVLADQPLRSLFRDLLGLQLRRPTRRLW